jgi:hypothetical protein
LTAAMSDRQSALTRTRRNARRSASIAFNLVHRNWHSVPENVTGAFEPDQQVRN